MGVVSSRIYNEAQKWAKANNFKYVGFDYLNYLGKLNATIKVDSGSFISGYVEDTDNPDVMRKNLDSLVESNLNKDIENEICSLACRRLYDILRERVRGYIKLRICGDELVVKITKNNDFDFVYNEPGFLDMCISGSDFIPNLAIKIIAVYRKSVLMKYFKEEVNNGY